MKLNILNNFIITQVTFCIIGLLLLPTSCNQNKASYLRDFRKFIEKTENNYTSYTVSEWLDTEIEYAEFTGERLEKVKESFNSDENRELAQLKGRFIAIQLKRQSKDLLETVESIYEEAKGVIEGLKNDTKNR